MAGVSFDWAMGPIEAIVVAAATNMANSKALAEEVGEILVADAHERFETERAPDGTAWEPSKRAQADGGKTLTDTATLKKSIGYEATPESVYVGSNLEYARIHQLGGKTGKNHAVTLPPRPYLGASDEAQEEIREAGIAFWGGGVE